MLGAGAGRRWGPRVRARGTGTAPLPARHGNAAKARRRQESPCPRPLHSWSRRRTEADGKPPGRGKRRRSRGSAVGGGQHGGAWGDGARPCSRPHWCTALPRGAQWGWTQPPATVPSPAPPSRPLPTPVPSAHLGVRAVGARWSQAEAEARGWLFTQFYLLGSGVLQTTGGGVSGRGGTSNGFVTSKKHGGGAGSALQLSQAGGRRGARRDGAGARPGSSLLLPPHSPNPRGLILTLPLPGANAGSEGNRGAGGCQGRQGAWLGISTQGGVVGGDVGPRGGPSPDPQGLMGPMPPSIQPQPPTSHTP